MVIGWLERPQGVRLATAIMRPEQPAGTLGSNGPTTGLRIIPSSEPGDKRPALAELVAADTEHTIREAWAGPGSISFPDHSALEPVDRFPVKRILKAVYTEYDIMLPAGRIAGTLAFSPDARILASENADQTISLCEISSGKERAHLGKPISAGQSNPYFGPGVIVVNGGGFARGSKVYTTLAFSPDGSVLISRGHENGVRVWDVAHAKEIAQFKGHAGEIQDPTIFGLRPGRRRTKRSDSFTIREGIPRNLEQPHAA